jgi:hypothetical protein
MSDVVEVIGNAIASEAAHAGKFIPGRVARALACAAIRAIKETT